MPRFDEQRFHRLIRGEVRGVNASLTRAGLGTLAIGYGLAARVRNAGYDRDWLGSTRAPAPVVSVGNLTLGGTGKTPTVEWVARWFRRRGVRVAVLSRGYSPGRGEGVNDEAMVLEENLPDVPHLQDPDRLKIAQVAVEELESQVLVLDDGFQHRRLARDLDVVLLDALDPFGLNRLFPRGLLREPVGSLRRAGVVILSRADLVDAERRAAIRREAERAAGPLRWVEASHAPIGLAAEEVGDEPLDAVRGRKVVAFCGIGNPEGFRRTVTPLVGELIDFRIFRDHHPYDAPDVAELARWARESGAGYALTTQKDYVKLRTRDLGGVPLRALKIGLNLLEGGDHLERALAAVVPPGPEG